MKIIIVGLNQTSKLLCDLLHKDKHEVIVIDSDFQKINDITNALPVSGVCGSVSSKSTLISAQAETADMLFALTNSDEANLVTVMLAKKLGTKYTVALMGEIEKASDIEYLKSEFGIDYIFNSKYLIAEQISRLIELPSSIKVESFYSNNCAIIELLISAGSELEGLSIKEVKDYFKTDLLVVSVKRKKEILIPDGEFSFMQDDKIGIFASFESIEKILRKLKMYHKKTNDIFIVGCGEIGEYLIPMLIGQGKTLSILDSSLEQCKRLKEKFPDIKVSFGDGIDENVLFEEGISKTDACIALTNADEKNLTISMFAWTSGIKTVITKMNSFSYAKLLHEVNIERTISPEMISLDEVVQIVRNRSVVGTEKNISTYHKIFDSKIETIEFIISKSFSRVDTEFKDPRFKLKKNILIAGIIRDGKTIIPNGLSTIKEGDHIIVTSLSKIKIRTPEDIFAK